MSWFTAKIGSFIHRALTEAKKAQDSERHRGPSVGLEQAIASPGQDPLEIPNSQTQFTVMKAANGRLVKVSEYKPTKSHHSDWQHEVYIVKDDEKVPDVIARIMAIKALEQ